jgi:hypothetical protein
MKEQQIESLELTLSQWQNEEPNSERGQRIIAEIEQELQQIKANNQELQNIRAIDRI